MMDPLDIRDVPSGMRKVWDVSLPEAGVLILTNVEDLVVRAELLAADFRDTHGVYHKEAACWLGFGARGLSFGKDPPRLVDGIWYVDSDPEKNAAYSNYAPRVEDMELRRLP
jgi:hypothetical protein